MVPKKDKNKLFEELLPASSFPFSAVLQWATLDLIFFLSHIRHSGVWRQVIETGYTTTDIY